MNMLSRQRPALYLSAFLAVLFVVLIYVALRSGPLAPVAVDIAKVQARVIHPALFGVATVEARYQYHIGPTAPGRVKSLLVQVGDEVSVGQLVAEMDPVDLDDRLQAQHAQLKRAASALNEVQARDEFARAQAQRYEQLAAARLVSHEVASARQQDKLVTAAQLASAREELVRVRAELNALQAQRRNLRLVAPVAGVVSARIAEAGNTVVAGQSVIDVIDPASVWLAARFDQRSSQGLQVGLAAQIVLRSAPLPVAGRVSRLEPLADAITEERMAKIDFEKRPAALPPIGELAEVTLALAPVEAALALPNSALVRQHNRLGVWLVDGEKVRFAPVSVAASDLDGWVQISAGLEAGQQVVTHSEKSLSEGKRVRVVPFVVAPVAGGAS